MALSEKADKMRNDREAQESGRRQAEEMLRLRHDEMFRQLMNVHQQSVGGFVDGILDEVSESAAIDVALNELKKEKNVVAPMIDNLDLGTKQEGDVIKDLVSSMLIPDLERDMIKLEIEKVESERVAQEQQGKDGEASQLVSKEPLATCD